MNLDSLLKQIGKDKAQSIPPLEKWHPELSGDMDMVIRTDGTWWHEGERINRQELVNLFSSILRHENNEYFLITPVEKWRIKVEDRPLSITLVEQEDGIIKLLTSTSDSFILDSEHPLKMSELNGINLPEVKVRHELWARFSRNAWYELLELAEEEGDGRFVVKSGSAVFQLGKVD